MYRKKVLCCVALIFSFHGCSGHSPSSDEIPAGTIRLVSATPVTVDVESANLLDNGGLEEWWAGAPAPSNFLPPQTDCTAVTRRRDSSTNRFVVLQEWHKRGCEQTSGNSFSVGTYLESITKYVLYVQATSGTGTAEVWIELEGQPAQQLIVAEAYPGLTRWYRGEFSIDQPGSVRIFAYSNVERRTSITWRNFVLLNARDSDAGDRVYQGEEQPVFLVCTKGVSPEGKVEVAPGGAISLSGWCCSDSSLNLEYEFGGDRGEITLSARPDVSARFPEAENCIGWALSTIYAADRSADKLRIIANGEVIQEFVVD